MKKIQLNCVLNNWNHMQLYTMSSDALLSREFYLGSLTSFTGCSWIIGDSSML